MARNEGRRDRDIGGEIMVVVVVVGVMIMALVFGLVLSYSRTVFVVSNATTSPSISTDSRTGGRTAVSTNATATTITASGSTTATSVTANVLTNIATTATLPAATEVAAESTRANETVAAVPSATITPTITPSQEAALSPSVTPTAIVTATATETITSTVTPTASQTGTATYTRTPTLPPTATLTATTSATATSSFTATPTLTPTVPPTATPTRTASRSATLSATKTSAASITPTLFIPTFIVPLVTATSDCTRRIGWVPYIVRAGETLFSIALQVGVPLRELQAANCIADANRIVVGQVIILPPGRNLGPRLGVSGTLPPMNDGLNAINCTNPAATITAPAGGAAINGAIAIFGTADIPNFSFYKLEIRPEGDPNWRTFATSVTTVQNNYLGSLNTVNFPHGVYWIQLVVIDQTANYPLPPCAVRLRFG